MKMRRFAVILLIICLLAGCGRQTEAPTPTETPVPTAEPTPLPTPEPLSYAEAAEENAERLLACSSYEEAFALLQKSAEEDENAWAERSVLSSFLPLISSSAEETAIDMTVLSGDYLYILTGKDLNVVRIYDNGAEVLNTLEVGVPWEHVKGYDEPIWGGYEKMPLSLFLADNRLAIVSDWYGYEGNADAPQYAEYMVIDIYDLTDPVTPTLLSTFGQAGVFSCASLSGNNLCLLTDCTLFGSEEDESFAESAPYVYGNSGKQALPAGQIRLAVSGEETSGALVVMYDLASVAQTDAQLLLGVAGKPYIDGEEIVFTNSYYKSSFSRDLYQDGKAGRETVVTASTDVYRLAYDQSGFQWKPSHSLMGRFGSQNICRVDGQLCALAVCDNFRYDLYGDDAEIVPYDEQKDCLFYCLNEKGGAEAETLVLPRNENIQWAGLWNGNLVLTSLEEQVTYIASLKNGKPGEWKKAPDVFIADCILPWSDGSSVVFTQNGSRKMNVHLYDAELQQILSRAFDSDHSSALENENGYLISPEHDLIAFCSDDSCCLYKLTDEGDIMLSDSIYLNDWSWNAYTFIVGDHLILADTREVQLHDLTTLENIFSLML